MEAIRDQAGRRLLVQIGLVVGPLLAVASVVIGLGPQPGSMREAFDVMAVRGGAIVAEDLLETLGFTVLLAALAASAGCLRGRGATLGTLGAVLSVVGIAGFGLSNGSGIAVVALAQLPDREAAFQTATALSDGGPLSVISSLGWMLEIVAQIGMLLVLIGLVRGRVIRPWPLVLAALGVAVNAVGGTLAATLVADALLVVTMAWVAVALTHTLEPVSWLRRGSSTAPSAGPARQAVP